MMIRLNLIYFFSVEDLPPPQSLCVRQGSGEGDLGDVRRWRWDGNSCHDAVVRTCPFFPAGLRPLRPDPAQQTAAPPGSDQPADQQRDEDACRGRKPLQVSPQSIPPALGYILPHAGESFWLFYPCLSHCCDPWHVQEAPAGCLLRGTFLDYQLLVFPPCEASARLFGQGFFSLNLSASVDQSLNGCFLPWGGFLWPYPAWGLLRFCSACPGNSCPLLRDA